MIYITPALQHFKRHIAEMNCQTADRCVYCPNTAGSSNTSIWRAQVILIVLCVSFAVQDELNFICSLYDLCFRQEDDDHHTADR
jgi:hypothetical protein